MAVCRIVMEGKNQKGLSWKNTLHSTLQSYEEGKIWFPAEVVLRSEMIDPKPEDRTLVLHRIHVRSARINTEVDPDQFTVKALKPIPGTPISRNYESDEPTEVWDGERVTSLSRPMEIKDPIDLRQPVVPQPKTKIFLLLGNVLVLVVVIFLCVTRWRRQT